MIELNQNAAQEFLRINNILCDDIKKIAGDCSYRSYYRIYSQDQNYVLMYAPTEYEDTEPFAKVDEYLLNNGLAVPKIYFRDQDKGFLLLEDLGDITLTKILAKDSNQEHDLYVKSVDCLIELHQKELPDFLGHYNNDLLFKELMVFIDWYVPYKNKTLSTKEMQDFKHAFFELFDMLNMSMTTTGEVVVLRDYHADNLMIQNNNVVLLDFQDAVIGSKAYDLVSLIEDARRDVSEANRVKIYDYFVEKSHIDKIAFKKEFEILSLQRNLKILGIFARMFLKNKKDNYLDYLPRVEGLISKRLESRSTYLSQISHIIKRFNLF
ncbi:MAG: phosphotransferase [Rickettsiales bacterium]|nr:phosphotransferase [Rickettsiales bacterium]